jgi:hypothetical protein
LLESKQSPPQVLCQLLYLLQPRQSVYEHQIRHLWYQILHHL